MKVISRESMGPQIDWPAFVAAIDQGHALPKAEVADTFLGPSDTTLLSRAARIEGIGFGVKSVTVMPQNPSKGRPSVQGGMLVFDEGTGTPKALIDSALITDIKTASDSVLGARYLARPDSQHLLVLGAGSVARNIIAAYCVLFPSLTRISIWSRTVSKARGLARDLGALAPSVTAVEDLAAAVSGADIISSATMAIDPILHGDWLRPGVHVDLIGAFRADMREADDEALRRAEIYVDSRDTTLHHIGELKIPLATGIIEETDIRGDLYQMRAAGSIARDPNAITLFKNGGGAHLDLMVANAILTMEDPDSDPRQS